MLPKALALFIAQSAVPQELNPDGATIGGREDTAVPDDVDELPYVAGELLVLA